LPLRSCARPSRRRFLSRRSWHGSGKLCAPLAPTL
jgi:hypothetical protein